MSKRTLCAAVSIALCICLLALVPMQITAVDMQVSSACVELIKQLEGFNAVPVWDYSQWTVGFGTTCPQNKLEQYKADGIPVEEAEALLAEKLVYFDERVSDFARRNGLTLTQGQYDTIFSLTYNCGAAWLSRTEGTLYQAIVNGATGNEFIAALSAWCTAGGNFLHGLMMRRLSEAEMYLYGRYSTEVPDYYAYVKFDANGGERSAAAQGFDTRYDAPITATATYAGYHFAGWYTEPTGGTKVTNLTQAHDRKTLYAHWTEDDGSGETIEPVTVTVTTDTLNVRASAGTGSAITAQVHSGDTLQITAVTTVSGSLWGRCEQGWVCLSYTDYAEQTAQKPESGSGKTYATITVSAVNVRKGPGTSYGTVTSLHYGDVVEILEQKAVDGKVWGRYERGWFRLTGFATLKTVEGDQSQKPEGPIVVPNPSEPSLPEQEQPLPEAPSKVLILGTDPATIRKGPHKTYPTAGQYAAGSKIEVEQFRYFMGELWAKSAQGWICVDQYVLLTDADTLINTFSVKVTTSTLYIREGPGADYASVRTVKKGAELVVYALKEMEDGVWGRVYCGWICLTYTNYDPSMVPDQTPVPDCETNGHSYEDSVTAPGCETAGYTTHTCTKCGHSYTDTPVAALGHSYTDTVQAPSCTEGGYTRHTCGTCGHSYTDGETSALGHSYTDVVTPPTSKEQGYTTHTCGNCGHSYVDSYTDPVKNTVTVTVSKTYATVTGGTVNVRKGPGTAYGVVTAVRRGDVVEILEQKTVDGKVWGRYNKGWFRLTGYATLKTVTESFEVDVEDGTQTPAPTPTPTPTPTPDITVSKTYATITAGTVNVRKGPGTSYGVVTAVRRGDVVEILEQKTVDGKVWGRYEKGWFRLTGYATLKTTNESQSGTTKPDQSTGSNNTGDTTIGGNKTRVYATLTASSVNVRKGPGASYGWVTVLRRGDEVEILEQKTVDGKVWGRCEKGWFRLTGYATLKTVN